MKKQLLIFICILGLSHANVHAKNINDIVFNIIAKPLLITWGSLSSLLKPTKKIKIAEESCNLYESHIDKFSYKFFKTGAYSSSTDYYLKFFLLFDAYLYSFILTLIGSGALVAGYHIHDKDKRKKYGLYAAGGTSLAFALNFLLAAHKCINFYSIEK